MADRLQELGVTRVVMEATSDYWKGVYYLLEAHGFEVWLVNARDVKHLPGRPKTDTLDAVWLCKLAERQMLRPSFVPPPAIRQLRHLTRYRADLVAARTAETQRVEKLLEDAQIKLSVVASDIFGVSGRAMLAALLAGERDPKVLAQLARARLRAKLDPLAEAFTGFFTDQHAFLLGKMLARVDALDADLADLDTKLAELIAPFTDAVERLDEIPGLGQLAAHLLIAELGVDMTRFPTAGHLVSWAKFAPGVSESAGKRKGSGSTGRGNPYLARVLETEGLVVTRKGYGSYVRERPPIRRVASNRRHAAHRASGKPIFDTEIEAQDQMPSRRMLEVGRTDAPADVAAWLRTKADEPVVVRRRLQLVNDEPVVLSASYFPLSVAEGTRLELPEPLPEGPDTAIEKLGYRSRMSLRSLAHACQHPRKPGSFA